MPSTHTASEPQETSHIALLTTKYLKIYITLLFCNLHKIRSLNIHSDILWFLQINNLIRTRLYMLTSENKIKDMFRN